MIGYKILGGILVGLIVLLAYEIGWQESAKYTHKRLEGP